VAGDPHDFKVALHRSEEGFGVTVPGLPGCCSQGDTEAEALANIADAIASTSKSRRNRRGGREREVEVAV